MAALPHHMLSGWVSNPNLICLAPPIWLWINQMQKRHTLDEWIAKAKDVLPAGGFGNFDPGIIISHGASSHV